MNAVDWIVVGIYLLGLIAMSAHFGRRQSTVTDYYLGGNRIPWWAIGLSTLGTQFSTNSFLGIPAFVALGLGGGLSVLQFELVLPISLLFVMACLHPFFRHAGVISVYEYLELRFGVGSRTALSVMFQLSRAVATGVTVYSVSLVLQSAIGIPLALSILLIGVFTVIYDAIGGMEAVVWSDVVQVVVIVTGIAVCTGAAVDQAGGIGAVFSLYRSDRVRVEASPETSGTYDLGMAGTDRGPGIAAVRVASAAHGIPPVATAGLELADPFTQAVALDRRDQAPVAVGRQALVLTGLRSRFDVLRTDDWGLGAGDSYGFWPMLFGLFFLYVSYYGCDQSQVQRQLASRNIDEARLSLFLNGVIRFALMGTLGFMGLAIGACLLIDLDRNAPFVFMVLEEPVRQNQMVIHFLLTYMPHGLIGIVIAAIISAAMSSLDSTINSLSATSMRDLYERFIDPRPSERTHLVLSRSLTVFWGAFCTGAAFLTPHLGSNVLVIINKIGSLTYGPILGVFLLAIFSRHTGDVAALIGLLSGVMTVMACWLASPISWLWWSAIGCLATYGAGYVAGLVIRSPAPKALDTLTWSPGISAQFATRRRWPIYYAILVICTVLYIAACGWLERCF